MKKTLPGYFLVFVLALISPAGFASPTVYIPLGSGNRVIAVDAATDTISASYIGVRNPHGLVATPDGEYLIAGSLAESPLQPGQSGDAPTSKLYLIHPAHGHVMSTIPVRGWTHHQAITPDGRYVISTHGTRGNISVLDLEANQIVRTVATGNAPNFTLISRDGKRAYVSNAASNTISEVDLSSWKVLRTLESGPMPEHMVFSGDGELIFVTNPVAGKVSVVDVKSGKLKGSYQIGKAAHGLDIGDDGKTIFATSKKDEKLVAIDTTNGTQRELKLSPEPYHLNTITGTSKIYVSSSKQPLIWVVDQKSLKVLKTLELPAGEGHQMAIVP